MDKIRQKITFFLEASVLFYKQHLGNIVFMMLVLGIFVLIRYFPYINIITQYNYYVVAAYIILIILLFRKQLPGQRLFIIGEVMVVLAFLADLFWIDSVAQFLGFTIFTLLFVAVFAELLTQRKKIKDF